MRTGEGGGLRVRISTKLIAFCVAVAVLLAGQFWLGRIMHAQMSGYLDTHEITHERALGLEHQIANLNELMLDLALPLSERDAASRMRHWLTHVQTYRGWQREGPGPKEGMPVAVAAVPSLATQESRLTAALGAGVGAVAAQDLCDSLRLSAAATRNRLEQELERIRVADAAELAHLEVSNRQLLIVALIAGGGGLTVLAVLAGLFLVRLSRTLRALRGKAKEIADGDYGAPLEPGRRDELADVIAAVNEIGSRLADRDRQLEELRVRFAEQEKLFALGIFAGGIAHEIRNPIQAIMALTDQISENLQEDGSPACIQSCVGQLAILSNQTERLNTLVSRVNEFARFDTADAECVDVHQAVQTTLALMRFDPRFKRAELALDLTADGPCVHAVHDHLVQALMNVLINAIDAIEDPPGRIVVRTRESAGHLVLEVEDDGPGMDADVLDHALEPFFTTKPKGRGTGLGLAVSRSVIMQAGGELTLRSEKGKGTVVSIVLPPWQSSCGEADESADSGRRDRVSAGS